MYTVNMYTVHMNVCMYLHMCGSIQKKSVHFIFSLAPFAIAPLALLIKAFKPFYPLNDILK